jgi:hypothetical protein
MRIDVNNTMTQAMAKYLKAQLPQLGNIAMEALKLAAKEDTTSSKLDLTALDIVGEWVATHGLEEGVKLTEKLAGALDGDITSLADNLTAEQLTELADRYQSAEAHAIKRTQQSMQRLGSVLGNLGRYAGRAFLMALV